jgi:hypothetical protein
VDTLLATAKGEMMAWDVEVKLEDRPGTLAAMGEALGGAGINIEGVCGVAEDGHGTIHILVSDPAAAREVLEEAGISTGEPREVLAISCEDRPGELGRLASRATAAGTNIDLVYVTMDRKVVLGVDDISLVKDTLGGD